MSDALPEEQAPGEEGRHQSFVDEGLRFIDRVLDRLIDSFVRSRMPPPLGRGGAESEDEDDGIDDEEAAP